MTTRLSTKLILASTGSLIILLIWWMLGPVAQVAAAPLDASHIQQQVDPAAVTSPTLISPEEAEVFTGNSAPPTGVPTLEWRSIPDAYYYRVELSSSQGFGDMIVDRYTIATSYTSRLTFADGTYYWRITAADKYKNALGPPSEVRTFIKNWCASGSIYPVLKQPVDGASFSSFANDHFQWEPVTGAASYKIEIATSDDFSTILYDDITIKPQNTPTKRLENNKYYWRVWPIDSEGNYGQNSPTWSFNFNWNVAPSPITPLDDAVTKFLPTFSWSAVEAADHYQLEVSTQPFSQYDGDFVAESVTLATYTTDHTDYTPKAALSNDEDYFWRVKAVDAQGSSSPYSEQRSLRIEWDFQPQLLTPLNNSIARSYAYFSWSPIPGIERYHIQIDSSSGFDFPLADKKIYNATSYTQPEWRDVQINKDYYWRVRGIDAQDNYTPWSTVRSFRIDYVNSPTHVYPQYYDPPDLENTPVFIDPTIAFPAFVWDTSFGYSPGDASSFQRPDYYILEVDDNHAFTSIDFTVETAGLSAAPTADDPFNAIQDGEFYYWRVRAIKDGSNFGNYTVWRTRIHRGAPQLAYSDTIQPIYPQDGFEGVEAAPMLGWLPVNGAVQYRVQVSKSSNFSAIDDEAIAQFVNYTPWQGRQTDIPYGAYYWRVRAENASGAPIGSWSQTHYFNVSRDLINSNQYDFTPFIGTTSLQQDCTNYRADLTYIADSASGPGDQFEVGDLHMLLDHYHTGNYNWGFSFEASATVSETVVYEIYIDEDHVANSGGTYDPFNNYKPIQTSSVNKPEYVILIERTDESIDATDAKIANWTGTSWLISDLNNIGGLLWFSAEASTIEVFVPYSAIGGGPDATGSLAVTVFSTRMDQGTGMLDSVPAQGSTIDRPAYVTDMLMPLYPFNTPLVNPKNPIIFTELPTVRWRQPYFDSVDGYYVEVARDPEFTDMVDDWETFETNTSSFFSLMPTGFHSLKAYQDNESYYWRVRIRHERFTTLISDFDYGPFSTPMRIKLSSMFVGNPQTSTGDDARITPTFRWERVEGASGYTLEVDDDSNFSDPIIDVKLDSTSYTPINALPDGSYYWRVATRRSDSIVNQWTSTMTFTKRSLTPVLVSPINGVVINNLPTFAWEPVYVNSADMRMAAPKYLLQIDDDPNMGKPDQITTQSTSFTVSSDNRITYNKFHDGQWYWRVAVVDADGNLGAFSETQTFQKEYLLPTLIGPEQGSSSSLYPNIQWEPIHGAAYYKVRVSTDVNLVNTATAATTQNTSFTPTDAAASPNLYWSVQMFDKDGNSGPIIMGQLEGALQGVFLPMLSRGD